MNSRFTGRNNEYDLFRTRVYGDLWYRDQFRVYAEFLGAYSSWQDLPPLPPDQNKADFDARLTKLATEAKAAEAKVTDLDSFKAQFTEVQKNCGGCHQTYRKRQS